MESTYDIKDDFMSLLERKNDFSGAEYLRNYFNEYKAEKNFRKKSLLKFCIYKLSSKLADGELKSFDCDVSKTVIESFPKTYGWLKGYTIANQKYSSVKYELTNGNGTFRGDTMTSVWTPLKSYIKLKTNTYSIDKSDEWELFILREADRINISAAAAEFICLSHSIGDFMPVPPGFNVGRSNMGRWDAWDITLTQIYRWYKDNPSSSQNINNAALETLFAHDRNKTNTVINCQKWLERFGTWNSFVKENYMESFLDKNGVPNEFFKGHSMSCPQPKTLDEFECFFQTASECIKKRGERIAAVLRGGNNSAARPQPKAQNVQKKTPDIHKKGLNGEFKKNMAAKISAIPRPLKAILMFILTIAACCIWSVISITVAVFINIIVAIFTGQQYSSRITENGLMVAILVGFAVIVIFALIIWRFAATQCRACKRFGALKFFRSDIVDEQPINIPKKVYREYPDGSRSSYTQYVQGARITYRYTYKCKYCGYETFKTRTKNYDNCVG